VRSWPFAVVMAVVAVAAGLWVVSRGQASGWILVVAAVPWLLLAILRATGGPRRM
jgi:hypothetical protein